MEIFGTVLQEAPAETFNYMLFGFVVILGSIGLYLVSLINRYRNLRRDMALLDEINVKVEASSENA